MLGFRKCHYMFANNILRNYSQKSVGVPRGDFLGFGCPNDALLSKTMLPSKKM